MDSFRTYRAESLALDASREAARLKREVANMQSEQKKAEFKRWQNESSIDEAWVDRNFQNLFQSIEQLYTSLSEQKIETSGLRKDLTRIEENVLELNETQGKQGKKLLLFEIREKLQVWQRLLSGDENVDNDVLCEIAEGLHKTIMLFQAIPNSVIFSNYFEICNDSKDLYETTTRLLRFLDESFSIFHSEMSQLLDLRAATINPGVIMDARRHDESLMKPYIDRVRDEKWREDLKGWIVEQIQEDIRVVKLFKLYLDPKYMDFPIWEKYPEHASAIKQMAIARWESPEFTYTFEIMHALKKPIAKMCENANIDPIQEEKCTEATFHNLFKTLPTAEESFYENNYDVLYYSYILKTLMLFNEARDIDLLYRDIDYFCHLKRFLDNKQIDPDNIPRLVNNLCIDRNFYANLRLLEVGLDKSDPENEHVAEFCKGTYRGFLTQIGALCQDAGLTLTADMERLAEGEDVSCTVNIDTQALDPFREGLSGTAFERAIGVPPFMTAIGYRRDVNAKEWIKTFNDRCIAARPLIELTSFPATPEELILILRKSLTQQADDGTIAHFDLLPFTLRLNSIMTGMFNDWTDADDTWHKSTWETLTESKHPTVEQLLALQVDLVNGKLYWTDGMEVTRTTASWHNKGRTFLNKNYSKNADIIEGVVQTADKYKFEKNCILREQKVQKTTFSI